jgi:hypothetical protein
MMKRAVLTFVLIAATLLPALAQKIETENTDRKQIIHLKTALAHLTVIELGEPVLQVASGSPSFKVEWRENKVFIQPTEADARTNLFIWTATQRLNYELEPAGAVRDMDFAIDQIPVRSTPVALSETKTQPAPPSVSDLLLEAHPVRMQSKQHGSKPVEIWINDLYEKDGQLLVRYTVFNNSTDAYSVNQPEVFQLDGVRATQSLYGLTNSQLNEEQANKLKVKHRVPVKVLKQEPQSETVAPGATATGIVFIEVSSSSDPTVLSFQFPGGERPSGQSGRPITAYLVR